MIHVSSPKKTIKQRRKTTQKNNRFLPNFIQNINTFLGTMHIFLHKKRTLKDTWRNVHNFFTEDTGNAYIIWESLLLI